MRHLRVFQNSFTSTRKMSQLAATPVGKTATTQQLTEESFKQLIKSKDAFLFDCDGVLWNERGTLDGAADLLQKLRNHRKQICFITNNSTSTRVQYVEKLAKHNLHGTTSSILCSAHATAFYLREKLRPHERAANLPPPLLYVIGSPALKSELESAGFAVLPDGVGPDAVPPDQTYGDAMKMSVPLEPVEAVVVGFDQHISFRKIMKAATYLNRNGKKALFIATNGDAQFPTSRDDAVAPGTGTMVAAVTTAAGQQPIVIGKPNTFMLDVLNAEQQNSPLSDRQRVIVIGDRLDSDIEFANHYQIDSILVMTGVTNQALLDATLRDVELNKLWPTYWCDSVKQLNEFL